MDVTHHHASELATAGVTIVRSAVPAAVAASAAAAKRYFEEQTRRTVGDILRFPEGAEVIHQLATGICARIAQAYLSSESAVTRTWIPEMSLVTRRFLVPAAPGDVLPYHQDSYSLPALFTSVNCWVLLYPSDTERAAGLEFVMSNLDRSLPPEPDPQHPTKKWLEPARVSVQAEIDRGGTWRPRIGLGDVAMFSPYILHRTAAEAALEPRIAIQCRFVGVTPFVVETYRENGQRLFEADGDHLRTVTL